MRSSPKLTLRLLSALAVVAAVLMQVGVASAATRAQGFHVTYAGSLAEEWTTGRPVVGSGPVNGRGTERLVSVAEGATPGSIVVMTDLVFEEGTLRLKLDLHSEVEIFANGCHFALSGTYEIVGASNALTGATGSGTVSGRETLFTARDGCQDGDCQLNSEINFKGWIDLPH